MKIKIIIFVLLLFVVAFFVSRNPLIVDDVHPKSNCPALLEKSDVIYVVPFFQNNSISSNKAWCSKMRSLNKTYGLHGIDHSYHEFKGKVDKGKLESSVRDFEACFDYKPELFRPPYNAISEENEELVESLGMKVYKKRFIEHPYCHCEPGLFMKPLNWLILC